MKIAHERDLKAIKYYQKKAVDIWNALLNEKMNTWEDIWKGYWTRKKRKGIEKNKNLKEITIVSVEAIWKQNYFKIGLFLARW